LIFIVLLVLLKMNLVIRLRAQDPFPPSVRNLLSTGFLEKLAEKLVFSKKNKESCALRKSRVKNILYRRMLSALPQRIFMFAHDGFIQTIAIASKMGCCHAAMYLGIHYKKYYEDWRTSVGYFTLAAEQGYTEAQYMVGEMLFSRAPEKAKKWLELAANKGHVGAQYHLGLLYHSSHAEKAMHWYTLAAKQGHADAQYQLGHKYNVACRYDDAVRWLRLSAAKGLTEADMLLLYILAQNPHLCQDETETKAIRLYLTSKELGSMRGDLIRIWLRRNE
jgi:hypothetical protein